MRWDESVKRGKIVSFSDNVKWSSKNLLKMISADTKTDVKQEIKELVAVSYNFSQKYLLKTWNTI